MLEEQESPTLVQHFRTEPFQTRPSLKEITLKYVVQSRGHCKSQCTCNLSPHAGLRLVKNLFGSRNTRIFLNYYFVPHVLDKIHLLLLLHPVLERFSLEYRK